MNQTDENATQLTSEERMVVHAALLMDELQPPTTASTLPIDHESNRLGRLVKLHENHRIYKHKMTNTKFVYFVWLDSERRGHQFETWNEALNHCGITIPVGCSDYEGQIRLGKLLERGSKGEIWKHIQALSKAHVRISYYVWIDGIAHTFSMLSAAREAAGINTAPKKEPVLTKPKSAYPQCQPGYDPHSHTVKKAAGKGK